MTELSHRRGDEPDAVLTRSAVQLRHMMDTGELSARELMQATLSRIEQKNATLNAFVSVRAEGAMADAAAADEAMARGEDLGPLHGLPLALKALGDYKAGLPEHSGSLPLADFVPSTTADHVAALENAGAIVVGTTNLPEFGHKGVTDNLVTGATSAPWQPGMNAGGSSGGAAAAVADYMCALAIGTDGGGSVRIPAAMCGAYGYKPSYGRVPAVTRPDGFARLMPFIHTGPITRTAGDAELLFDVMSRPDDRDPTSLPAHSLLGPVDPLDVTGMRIGYTPDYGGFPIEPAVRAAVEYAAEELARAGATVVPVNMELPCPHNDLAEIWLRMVGVEAAGNAVTRARSGGPDYFELLDQLTPEYAALLELGKSVSAVDLRLDQIARTGVYDALEHALHGVDVLIGPTLSVATIPNRDDGLTVGPSEVEGQTVNPLIGWCPTYLQNFSGHPAASIPAAHTYDGAPVGLQVMGRRFADHTVLAASKAFERVFAP
ncbi:MAG: amidase [Leucobacter sp.]